MIDYESADDQLKSRLDKVRGKNGAIDNVMRVHSLRPETMAGHHKLYMSALHCEDNTLEEWFLEVMASYVSVLNQCDYSYANHFSNARHLINDDKKADAIEKAMKSDNLESAFEKAELQAMHYVKKLTLNPAKMNQQDVQLLKQADFDDGQILEINQICGYFNYVNRLLNGLGVSLAGDTVGYYTKAST